MTDLSRPPADWLLYEHSDGRHAVAPSAEAFARGDPAWHRVGPVEVHGVMGAPAPRQAGNVMMSAHALCPTDMPHPKRMEWMADYFLKHYAAGVPVAQPGPGEADCGMCKGRGFYGSPGARCQFCKGAGKVRLWRPADDDGVSASWMTDYEKAFQAANGRHAKVVICGGGWYRVFTDDHPGFRRRKADIIAMTARLEQRAATPTGEPQ
jgi:hypothetical protein